MNATRIVTIVCWAISVLALLGLALWFFTGFAFGFNTNTGSFNFGLGGFEILTGPYEAAGTYSVPVSGVNSLHVDWPGGSVTALPYDGADIQLTEYARRELEDGERLTVNTSGGAVTIGFRESGNHRRMPSKRLEVLVPRALCENIDRLTLETTSGDIIASGFKTGSLKSSSASGAADLADIKARSLHAESTSGSITISSAEAGSITLNSTSGRLSLSEVTAKTLKTDTTSGSHNLSGSFDSADLNSISGSITLNNSASGSGLISDTTSGAQKFSGSFESASLRSISGTITFTSANVPGSLETDTTSGSVAVTVPDEGGITVYHSATSGKFSSDIPVIMQSREARFRFSSTSGDVRVLALG